MRRRSAPTTHSFSSPTPTRTIRVGLRNAYHVPGEGVVLLDAVRLILDPATGEVTVEAGQHELVEGSVGAFCNYFES
jgi:hypothetical protein